MHEEASLQSALMILCAEAESMRMRFNPHEKNEDPTWLTQLVTTLDMALQLTGAPGRAQIFEKIFRELHELVPHLSPTDQPPHFSVTPPTELETQRLIPRHSSAPEFEEFQAHLDEKNTPIIIKRALQHWPACTKWTSPSYWSNITLGGRRLVPVEVGAQYTEEGWSQRIIPFREFLRTYLLAESSETGYLAQYDLFAQIPALRSDVQVPDYCYCSPPKPKSTATTDGDVEIATEVNEPLMNLWLGPAGTKTPLHTDPYSNILAQVMGYKYARLYAPTETARLYPMGIDDKGVDMNNTSSVDVSLVRSQHETDTAESEKINRQRDMFPLFVKAHFVEGVLGPGECLYIPQGWWHYIEGLTLGASVSFWWN
jgi:lysine-specific demethylase 8